METIPSIETQIQLEKLFSKNQLIPRIKSEFIKCEAVDFHGWFNEINLPPAFGFDLLTQMAIHKRANLQTMIGLLRHHFKDGQKTADMLLLAAQNDLIDWSPNLKLFIVKYTISKDVQREIDQYQYPLPMVVRPRRIKKNTDTGYISFNGSVILKNNHHEDDVCLDHLNRMNAVKFSIDLDTATMIKNQWRNLDKPKSGETVESFDARKRAFDKYDRVSKNVMKTLEDTGNKFYLTHKYDKRGRVYCQGYHVNYQGTAWNKAVVQLADKEIIE